MLQIAAVGLVLLLIIAWRTLPAFNNSLYEIVAEWRHDTTSYTEGLVYRSGVLYESTGLYGRSEIRKIDLRTGRILASRKLDKRYFGEGLAFHAGRLYQLTWESGVALVYNAANLALIDSLNYQGEGWGLTSDGTHLIMSDGSPTLRFFDADFQLVREIIVLDGGMPLGQLNELEWVSGRVLANIYGSDSVASVDPRTGEVIQWYGFRSLRLAAMRFDSVGVLNGIAVDSATGHWLLTGKHWPTIFEVRVRSNSDSTIEQ